MKKINRSFLLLLSIILLISSCNDDPLGLVNPFEDVNYEILAKEDDATILKFLSTHYYNESLDSIKAIENGEVSLLNSTNNLKIQEITNTIDNKEITFKLYTYVIDKGIETEGKPSNVDSLLVNYSGRSINPERTVEIDGEEVVVGNALSSVEFDSNINTWIASGILGWSYGFTNFSPGEQNSVIGERISFDNAGKGFIFMPSGLAYPSSDFILGNDPNALPYDNVLVFNVELLSFIEDTDHDRDGIPSILEDANCDGNPRNDFNDINAPSLPDFLNPNISDENKCN